MQIVLFYIYTEDIDWKFLLCNYPMRYHAERGNEKLCVPLRPLR